MFDKLILNRKYIILSLLDLKSRVCPITVCVSHFKTILNLRI